MTFGLYTMSKYVVKRMYPEMSKRLMIQYGGSNIQAPGFCYGGGRDQQPGVGRVDVFFFDKWNAEALCLVSYSDAAEETSSRRVRNGSVGLGRTSGTTHHTRHVSIRPGSGVRT